jgi:hypothetical protein
MKIIITQVMLRLLVMTITGPAQAELEYNLVVMMAGLGLQICTKKKGYTVQITNAIHQQGAYMINARLKLTTFHKFWNRFLLH